MHPKENPKKLSATFWGPLGAPPGVKMKPPGRFSNPGGPKYKLKSRLEGLEKKMNVCVLFVAYWQQKIKESRKCGRSAGTFRNPKKPRLASEARNLRVLRGLRFFMFWLPTGHPNLRNPSERPLLQTQPETFKYSVAYLPLKNTKFRALPTFVLNILGGSTTGLFCFIICLTILCCWSVCCSLFL